jgi:hypothetical protein
MSGSGLLARIAKAREALDQIEEVMRAMAQGRVIANLRESVSDLGNEARKERDDE